MEPHPLPPLHTGEGVTCGTGDRKVLHGDAMYGVRTAGVFVFDTEGIHQRKVLHVAKVLQGMGNGDTTETSERITRKNGRRRTNVRTFVRTPKRRGA